MFRFCPNCKYFTYRNFFISCEERVFLPMRINHIHPNYIIRQCPHRPKKVIPFKFLYKAAVRWLARRKEEIHQSAGKAELIVKEADGGLEG